MDKWIEDNNLTIEKLQEAIDLVRERIIKDAMFVSESRYSPFVRTGQMKHSYISRPWFNPTTIMVIESEYATERVTCCRQRKEVLGFWERLKQIFRAEAPLSYWQYTPIEFYDYDKPALFWMESGRKIICHPSLAAELKTQFGQI